MHTIQSIVLPGCEFGAPFDMYYRQSNEHTTPVLSGQKRIIFSKKGVAHFDTYFNSLSVSKWRSNCNLDDVSIKLKGKGKFSVFFGIHRAGCFHRWLSDSVVELNEDGVVVKLPNWDALDSGLLYFSIKCLSDDGVLLGGEWVTNTPPLHGSMKLGIVVTHFNRKDYVLPAISRVKKELLDDPAYTEKIEMVVVDNSRNISEEESNGVTVLPNNNLGGSGGFTRGLMHLKEKGFTYCLFMDDDASCEVESIRRAYNFLSFGTKENLALSGGLLRELEPYRLFEKGAKFDGTVHPLKSGLDMRSVHDLMVAEEGNYEADYGAWWFFAFPIDKVKNFPFPFFVRGDDILFGKINNFNIETMVGVSCWGEDFGLKSSPMSTYLDVRNHLVQNYTHINSSFSKIFSIIIKFFISNVFSYNYSSARAVSKAIEDFMKGPSYWRNDLDASEARSAIAKFGNDEKLRYINKGEYDLHFEDMHESYFRKLLRILTLNGFLLPSFFVNKNVVFQEKGFRANFREVFLHRRVLYLHTPSSQGYIAEYSKKRFFKESFRFSKKVFELWKSSKDLRGSYNKELPKMTSEEFWNEVYSK